MNTRTDFELITHPQGLADLASHLGCEPWFALDTEFLREKTYYPRLGLIQVATQDRVACVDPLAIRELGPLLEVIYDPAITKVMHASRQDLEIFHHLRGYPPPAIFDTQLAAQLLGLPDQVGYGALVAARLDIHLSKAHTRADWTRRPLPQDELRYAADDVIYLCRLYPGLREELEDRGRLGWLEADFAALSDADLYTVHPEHAWKRIRGRQKLSGASLSVLQALAEWRETMAQAADRPRGWILRDEVLLDLARRQPKGRDSLERVRGMGTEILKRHGDTLLGLMRDARSRPPPEAAEARHGRMRPEQAGLVEAMMAVVQLRARQESLNAASLANRSELEQLVLGQGELPVLTGWRKAMVGRDLRAFMEGRLSLRCQDDELRLVQGSGAD